MEIRKLQPDDADAWWNLRLAGLEREPEAFGKSPEEHRAMPVAAQAERFRKPPSGAIYLGAFDNDCLVGMMTFLRHENNKERHKGGLYGVYVKESHRGRGVGKSLLRAVVAHAISLPDLEQILLAVGSDQAAAQALYRSFAFAPFGREVRSLRLDDGRYVDEDHMVLFLQRPACPRADSQK